MTSTHTRPAEPTRDSPVESLAPLPAPLSLAELRAALSSPGLIRAEVDALLAAIAQRPDDAPEALRERTDYLLSLLTLPGEASVLTGSTGVSVHTAAVEALLDLGYPYALEVPPEALEQARRERGLPRSGAHESLRHSPSVATAVTLLSMVWQLYIVGFFLVRTFDDIDVKLVPYLIPTLAPGLLAILGTWMKVRPLQYLGSLSMGLQGLLYLVGTLLLALVGDTFTWLWFGVPWHVTLAAGVLLWPQKQPDASLPPPEEPPAAS